MFWPVSVPFSVKCWRFQLPLFSYLHVKALCTLSPSSYATEFHLQLCKTHMPEYLCGQLSVCGEIKIGNGNIGSVNPVVCYNIYYFTQVILTNQIQGSDWENAYFERPPSCLSWMVSQNRFYEIHPEKNQSCS